MHDAPSPDACRAEVERLHDAFVAHYTGRLDDFAAVADALAPGFELVSPDGDVLDRETVVESIERQASAYYVGDFEIDIRNTTRVAGGLGYALVRYEEWQATTHEETGRVSTALLVPDESAPEGVAWAGVQETWLSEPGD